MMESVSSEKIQQALLQRWRSGDQSFAQFSPSALSGSPTDTKFLDENLLTELMDLDPLIDPQETWGNASSPGSEFYFPFGTSSSPPTSLISSAPSSLFHAVNSITNPQAYRGEVYTSLPIHSSGLPRTSETSGEDLQRTTSNNMIGRSRGPGGMSLAMAKARNDFPLSSFQDFAPLSTSTSLDRAAYLEQTDDLGTTNGKNREIEGMAMKQPTEVDLSGQQRAAPLLGTRGLSVGNLMETIAYPRETGVINIGDDFLEMLGSAHAELVSHGKPQDYRDRLGRAGGSLKKKEDSLKDRMKAALELINSSTRGETLTQIWMPTTIHGNKLILSTQDQPFVCAANDNRLSLYRNLSSNFVFPIQKGSSEYPGLPGRVYISRAPEWTPNVRYYNPQEFLRFSYAAQCNVKGTLAVPVFEETSKSCLAVIELITKAEKIEYGPELDIICGALKAVNLSTTGCQVPPAEVRPSSGRHTAVQEIQEVLTAVCETHKLPLAQTWVPSWTEGALEIPEISEAGPSMSVNPGFSVASPKEPRVVLHTEKSLVYVADPQMWGFRHASLEHILEKNQGVPGKAYSSNQPVFESDVRSYSKLEYPLGHYAKMFRLSAAVAIRLRSIHTGTDDYVLEFFLPPSCIDGAEQQALLNALSITMQRVCRSLRTVTAKEIEEERERGSDLENKKVVDVRPVAELVSRPSKLPSEMHPTRDAQSHHQQEPEKSYQQSHQPQDPSSPRRSPDENTHGESDPWRSHPYQPSGSSGDGHEGSSMKRRLERRRGSNEKTIGLNVLQQYFAGSLKDAAKSIGVCPTTLKRICRQHGISRWPSRKINKVSRSLKKLQGVIDSVQGADGALRINADLASAAAAAAAAVNGVQLRQENGYSPKNKWTVSWATPGPGGANNSATGGNSSVCGPPQQVTSDPMEVGDKHSPSREVATSAGELDVGGRTEGPEPAGVGAVQPEQLASREDDCSQGHSSRGDAPRQTHGRGKSRAIESRVHGGAAALAALRGAHSEDKVLGCSRLGFAGLASNYRGLQISSQDEDLEDARHHSSSGLDGSSHTVSSSRSRGSDCGSPSSGVGSHHRVSPTGHDESPSSTTVKATYGTDTVRFKMLPNGGYQEVRDEVANRLKLPSQGVSLKYFDDDGEWCLLACDADLEECLEVMRSTRSHAIKLMVRVENSSGSSSGSTGDS